MTIDPNIRKHLFPQLIKNKVIVTNHEEVLHSLIHDAPLIYAVDIMSMLYQMSHKNIENDTWFKACNRICHMVRKKYEIFKNDKTLLVICVDKRVKNTARMLVSQMRQKEIQEIEFSFNFEIKNGYPDFMIDSDYFPCKEDKSLSFEDALANGKWRDLYLYPILQHFLKQQFSSFPCLLSGFSSDKREFTNNSIPTYLDETKLSDIAYPVEGDCQLAAFALYCGRKNYNIITDTIDGDMLIIMLLQKCYKYNLDIPTQFSWWWLSETRKDTVYCLDAERLYNYFCETYKFEGAYAGFFYAVLLMLGKLDYVNIWREQKIHGYNVMTALNVLSGRNTLHDMIYVNTDLHHVPFFDIANDKIKSELLQIPAINFPCNFPVYKIPNIINNITPARWNKETKNKGR